MSTESGKFRIAVIGLGNRGSDWAKHILKREDAQLVAVCDKYSDRVESICDYAVKETDKKIKYAVSDYRELLDKDDIDIVMIITSWESHVPLAADFMKAGIITALEVGGAYSINDCYKLVRTWEQTKTPFFFMENCCYGKREMMVKNMVRDGLFGEIVHCSGAYAHDLREEIVSGEIKRHYRMRNYINRNCENYPTHELGPIAKILNVNNGNRMLSLTSVASKAAGLHDYAAEKYPQYKDVRFKQGDIVNTIITCAGGETILLTLDTSLPRSYSRAFQVRGTKGMYYENNDMVFLNEHTEKYEFDARALWGNASQYEEKYLDDLWRQDFDKTWGHDGMDVLMLSDFLRCVGDGKPMPIDVYDAASWMAISCLSEDSIQKGGAAVAIPDFTEGMWIK